MLHGKRAETVRLIEVVKLVFAADGISSLQDVCHLLFRVFPHLWMGSQKKYAFLNTNIKVMF